ncbi:MAG: Mut7-C RNAse domain-containing protein [Dehalococcoidales bacterium]
MKEEGRTLTPSFIVDANVGKLARWLRMAGYDTLYFKGTDDSEMVTQALEENRIILTGDSQITKRNLVTSGKIKAVLIKYDQPERQMLQVIDALGVNPLFQPFSICLECNEPLIGINKSKVQGRVPPYVYQNHETYMECPQCHRLFWKGTHWQAMIERLKSFSQASTGFSYS